MNNVTGITVTSTFEKHYKNRIKSYPALKQKLKERLDLLISNPTNPTLKNHELKGNSQGFYSFSVTGDIRVIYKTEPPFYVLLDI